MRKQLPIDGEERTVRVFALFPIKCVSQELVWLEWANIHQRYTYGYGNVGEGWKNCNLVKDDAPVDKKR